MNKSIPPTFQLRTLHSVLCTLHAALCTLLSALCTLHAALCTLLALCTLHAALCTLLALCTPHSALAEPVPSADYDSEIDKSAALITPEAVATLGALIGPDKATDLAHAMKLIMTAYDLDMKTATGRQRWHGRLIREEFPTNSNYKVEVYSNDVDHAVWRYRVRCKPKAKTYAAPRLVQLGTNAIPARLAAIRARRNAELAKGTVVTNVEINANAPTK